MSACVSIIIGPALESDAVTLLLLLADQAAVHRSPSRYSFRSAVRLRHRPKVVVLFERDADGTPNEPLIQYCLARSGSCCVIFVCTGQRLSGLQPAPVPGRLVRLVFSSPLPPREARLLADIIRTLLGQEAHGRAGPSRNSVRNKLISTVPNAPHVQSRRPQQLAPKV